MISVDELKTDEIEKEIKIESIEEKENGFSLQTSERESKFQWVVPLIEGMPPSPRGGHTATKVGRFLIIFGVE